jgi:hypothetical protein
MIRRRATPDGLPFRVYERRGVRDYSIGFKAADGTWTFRLKCPIDNKAQILALRRDAITRANRIGLGAPADGSFDSLAIAWLARQKALPSGSTERRADSTLAENERELAPLRKAFGHMQLGTMEKSDAYAYLDACLTAVDRKGVLRPRPEKGNKEVALARAVLEYGIRVGKLKSNPFDGVEKLKTEKTSRLVTHAELALAVEMGRRLGGPRLIVALGLQTAYLCLRRSVEVRALTRPQITEEGIEWTAAKRKRGTAAIKGLIEWSPALRATIDEAVAIPRRELAGSWFVFGNLNGQRYTKGGWKATLSDLMAACVKESAERKLAFLPFSLQDCRPMGVTEKKSTGQDDVMDATMHTSERMIDQIYDRRRTRTAKPAR